MDPSVSVAEEGDGSKAPKMPAVPLPNFVFPMLKDPVQDSSVSKPLPPRLPAPDPAQTSSSAAGYFALGSVTSQDVTSTLSTSALHSRRKSVASQDVTSTLSTSALHSRRKSVTPLPPFDFNSTRTASPSERMGSPKTPPCSQSPPPRSGGHRRGGSEFIGGDRAAGGSGLMSVSPTKGESALTLPVAEQSPEAAGRRRGHAHRRSGAVSCHELSRIPRPSTAGVSASAPTSPFDSQVFTVNEAPPRARVGFSDTVEYIPRALSPLSESSSNATVSGSGEDHSFGMSPPRLRWTRIGTAAHLSVPPNGSVSPLSSSSESSSDEVLQRAEGPASEPDAMGSLTSSSGWGSSYWADRWQADHARALRLTEIRRTASPPPGPVPYDPSSSNINLDIENTCVIVSPNFRYSIPPPSTSRPEDSPRQSSSPRAESTTPVIDLDAEIDTSGEPRTGSLVNDGSRSGFAGVRRRLHSFGATGGLRGPGMDHHRRTESAPELAGFESRRSLHGVRSGTAMEDVFEEDEEDDTDKTRTDRRVDVSKDMKRENVGIGIDMDNSYESSNAKSMNSEVIDAPQNEETIGEAPHLGDAKTINKSSSEEVTEKDRYPTPVSRGSGAEDHGLCVVVRVDGADEGADAQSHSQPSARTAESTVDPVAETSRKEFVSPGSVVGVGLLRQYQNQWMGPPSVDASTTASPELPGTPFDQPKAQSPNVLTSRTSLTDERTAQSMMMMGERSPDMLTSTDDIPSLASDRSTMASGVYNYASPASRPYSNEGGAPGIAVRTGSMTSYATSGSGLANSRPTTAKRSSLVSLSKLMGGSRGERSNLSIEAKPESESPEKTATQKKTKRLHRFMSFLKKTNTVAKAKK